MPLPIGTLAEYCADTGQGGPACTNGAYTGVYTDNPIQPLGQVSIVNPTQDGDGELTGRFEFWPPDDCSCGQPCGALAHEATTGYWVQFYSGDCGGTVFRQDAACPPDECDPCWNEDKVPFFSSAQDAFEQSTLPGTKLANVFPGWSLLVLGLTGAEPADFDFIAIVCDPTSAENFDNPKIDLTFQLTCEMFELAGLGTCEPANAPPPVDFGPPLGGPFLDPPLPLASDGIGFSMPAGPFALPVHPVLSAARVRQVCGTCGPDDSEGISEEMEL